MPEEGGEEAQEEEKHLIVTLKVGSGDSVAEKYRRDINMAKIACYECLSDCWISVSSVNILAEWQRSGMANKDILVLCMECADPYLAIENVPVANVTEEQMQEINAFMVATMGDDRCT